MDVEKIAKGLSEAQRRLLAALPDNGKDAILFWNGEYRKFPRALVTFRALRRKGYAGVFGEAAPLGLAVREYLEKSDD